MATLLDVQLSAGYRGHTVLKDLSFRLDPGERLGLVGTSGAGKSTLLLALLGLLPWRGGWVKGEVRLQGTDLLGLKEREARRLRGKLLALVPQNPGSALNSALSLQTHFQEAWRAHESAGNLLLSHRMEELLRRVHLPTDRDFLRRRPGEISVGQAQRCAIALALLHRPALLIADEPTSALDPATQVEVLALLREISDNDGTALLFVSHDLLSVLRLCTGVAVLSDGCIPECLSVENIAEAEHPALRHLLQILPVPPGLLLRHLAGVPSRRQLTPFTDEVMTPRC